MAHEIYRHWLPEEEHHSDHAKKLAGITSRLQNVMLTENITADELVGCARVVRRNHASFKAMEKNERPPAVSPSENNDYFCSFCGKGNNEVSKMVTAPKVYICNECVELCEDIITGFRDN
ncbi:ClpX C4-type zinc finger protein [Serratia sp. Tan611]|uniref:ClpX C4-type zinc finger protein n=1 Tax=Serratia sp. Tan611 TaxID=2773264 RepID=UPI001AF80AAC|nr:ClpX C4-type zinc finger protein [Serratia sp. Tan611]CAE1145019.1 protein of unknown function [Serratia sp. Tan611]